MDADSRRIRRMWMLVAFLILWAAVIIFIAAKLIPDLYFYSYYSVNYALGFVRRGLAGELLRIFPDDQYFNGLRVLRWIPSIAYGAGLAAVAWCAAFLFGRSERRSMLGLLVPVLPFGAAFALFSARPDLLGGAAVAFLAVVAARSTNRRTLLIATAVYGLVSIPLTLMHEATPFLYSLGAIGVIASLGRHNSRRDRYLSSGLAIGPGVATGAALVLFGRRGISAEQCQLVPHGAVDHPLAGKPTAGQILRGFHFNVDYHDWFCRFILPYFDQSFGDAARFVFGRGFLLLSSSVVFGIALFALTVSAIAHVSGVRFSDFAALLRSYAVLVCASVLLLMPVFITGVDWTRWFVTMSFDLGVPFLLYASSRPEAAEVPTARTVKLFTIGVVALAVFPLGIVPGFAGTMPG